MNNLPLQVPDSASVHRLDQFVSELSISWHVPKEVVEVADRFSECEAARTAIPYRLLKRESFFGIRLDEARRLKYTPLWYLFRTGSIGGSPFLLITVIATARSLQVRGRSFRQYPLWHTLSVSCSERFQWLFWFRL